MEGANLAAVAPPLKLPALPSWASASDIIRKNTITIDDPRDIYVYQRLMRRREFYSLVQKFRIQLREGCGSLDCTMPTCLTFRRRVSRAPIRRHTELSARSIAHFLASEDNPEDGLCRALLMRNTASQDEGSAQSKVAFSGNTNTSRDDQRSAGNDLPVAGAVQAPSGNENLRTGVHEAASATGPPKRASRKDPKSFTQNLFDTDIVRTAEWNALYNIPIEQVAESLTPDHKTGEVGSLSSSNRIIPNSDSLTLDSFNIHSAIKSSTIVTMSSSETPDASPNLSYGQGSVQPIHDKEIHMKIAPSTGNGILKEPAAVRHTRKVSFNNFGEPAGTEAEEQDTGASDEQDCGQDTMATHNHNPASKDSKHAHTLSHFSLDMLYSWKLIIGYALDDAADEYQSSLVKEEAYAFTTQSVTYILGHHGRVLQSFRADSGAVPGERGSQQRRFPLDAKQLDESFQILDEICPRDVTLHSLWKSLEDVFNYPDDLLPSSRDDIRFLSKSKGQGRAVANKNEYINDADAAYILFVAFSALTSSVTRTDPETWTIIRQMRAEGKTLPSEQLSNWQPTQVLKLINITDKFDDELALRLGSRLARAISARVVYHEVSKGRRSRLIRSKTNMNVVDGIVEYLRRCAKKTQNDAFDGKSPRAPNPAMAAVEFLRTLVLKDWDGSPEIHRSSAAGGAIQLLAAMYKNRDSIGLRPEDFQTPFLAERLNLMEMPAEFLTKSENNRTIHLLRHPYLFPPKTLVQYFRAMNYSTMSKYYEEALANERHLQNIAMSSRVDVQDRYPGLVRRMQTATLSFLLVVARRDQVVIDALDQLWRREKRELLRPLKVIMGMQEGEEGVDHGGVQQEFFRTVMAEILNPDYGMFTVDKTTYSAWFQPGSLEPLYKFELLGLLVSLAVYNGLTLPVNFPVALYMKLLDEKVRTIEHIRVGWPELAKGFDDLVTWDDGDVGDVFMRTYEFSFEAFGSIVNVDMERVGRNEHWAPLEDESPRSQQPHESPSAFLHGGAIQADDPFHGKGSMLQGYGNGNMSTSQTRAATCRRSLPVLGILKVSNLSSPSSPTTSKKPRLPAFSEKEEASMVTNENREQFVKDYIFWLTDKSIRPQYEAFARGFYACLDRTALSIFTPGALKKLVEGSQHIDILELKKHTRYNDGYQPDHPTIIMFWDIVEQFTPAKMALLLEFVTASDRVPVNGISSIMFMIQRAGNSDERLPTSMTCFGRLLLPEYSSRAIMEEKLDKALQNTKGFGSP